MTENEEKAVRFIENIKNHAMVTLDHIAREEPNVNPLLYRGREEKANTILVMVQELEQYRAIGTLEELKAAMKYVYLAKKHGTVGQVIENCVKYEEIGTPEECRAAVDKQTAKKPYIQQEERGYCFECPSCDSFIGYEVDCKDEHYRENYCPNCGQELDWSEDE